MPTQKNPRLFAVSVRRFAALIAIVTLAFGAGLMSLAPASTAAETSGALGRTAAPDDGHYCDGCQPPLEYTGGPVMDTESPKGVVVIPVFWSPPGADQFPDVYINGIDRYIADVAAASGQHDNVYSVLTEYNATADGSTTPLRYRITAGSPIADPSVFPGNGCTPESDAARICITDQQLRNELARIIEANRLPTGLSHFYPVFLPPGVETMDRDKTTSASSFCGYHRLFGEASDQVVYGNEPFEASNCDGGQSPNGSLALDGAISTLSHELAESVTDPNAESSAWLDRTDHEIGDICADDYGTASGSVDPAHPFTTEYNQVINGDKYYTQTEFSNSSYTHYGMGYGCAQSERQATTDPARSPHDIAEVFSDVTPNTTDKKEAKAGLRVTVYDRAGDPVSGDAVSFTAYVVSGDGTCGDFSASAARTDDAGEVTTTYTGSPDPVTCALVAHEARGGHSGTSRIYQCKAADTAPQAFATFPASLEPGGAPRTFTTTFTNPTNEDIRSSQVEFDVYAGDKSTVAVHRSDLHVSYSTHGADGPFTTLSLHGSTADGSAIYGFISPKNGLTARANSNLTVYYRLNAGRGLPTKGTAPRLSLEAYLDQVNPATGAGTTIADTYAADVRLDPPQPWYLNPWPYVGLALVLLIVALCVVLLVRRSHRRPAAEPRGL